MKKFLEKVVAICLVFVSLQIGVRAQEAMGDSALRIRDHIAVSFLGNGSYLIPKGDINKEILHSYGVGYYDVRMKWHTRQEDGNAYDAVFRYPDLQVGFLYGDLSHIRIWREQTGYESRIGHTFALYGGFQRKFIQRGRWTLSCDFQNGISYCTDPFNEHTNTDNELIGARLSLFVNIGVHAHYRLTPQWSLSLGVDFKHCSNGQLARPNLGTNTFGPTLGVSYDLEQQPLEPVRAPLDQPSKKMRSFYFELSAGALPKVLLDHFTLYHTSNNPMYVGYTSMLAAMYRYRLHHASGLEADYTYAPYADNIRELDIALAEKYYDKSRLGFRYSRHVAGIGVRHEVFYKHVSLNLGLGVYVFRHMGYTAEVYESRLYQILGLRYSLPFTSDRLFLGYNVKAHKFSKADCLQFVLGWRFTKK